MREERKGVVHRRVGNKNSKWAGEGKRRDRKRFFKNLKIYLKGYV